MGFLIDMIAVGQGDAFMLTLGGPNGDIHFLVDGGPPGAGDKVADFVTKYTGGNPVGIIGTHLDLDHIGGLATVVRRCSIGAFYLNLPKDINDTYRALLIQRLLKKKTGKLWDRIEKNLETAVELFGALSAKTIVPQSLVAGESFALGNGNIRMNVLNPTQQRLDEAWAELRDEEDLVKSVTRSVTERLRESFGLAEATPETSAENNSSVVLEIAYNGIPHALLTSDAGADVLREVTQNRSYTFLKVPHHGSKTGLDEALIAQLAPKTAFIPVGTNNYGHPTNEILDLLRKYGAATFCSEKVKDCRQACPTAAARDICQPYDRPLHDGWGPVAACTN